MSYLLICIAIGIIMIMVLIGGIAFIIKEIESLFGVIFTSLFIVVTELVFAAIFIEVWKIVQRYF